MRSDPPTLLDQASRVHFRPLIEAVHTRLTAIRSCIDTYARWHSSVNVNGYCGPSRVSDFGSVRILVPTIFGSKPVHDVSSCHCIVDEFAFWNIYIPYPTIIDLSFHNREQGVHLNVGLHLRSGVSPSIPTCSVVLKCRSGACNELSSYGPALWDTMFVDYTINRVYSTYARWNGSYRF